MQSWESNHVRLTPHRPRAGQDPSTDVVVWPVVSDEGHRLRAHIALQCSNVTSSSSSHLPPLRYCTPTCPLITSNIFLLPSATF